MTISLWLLDANDEMLESGFAKGNQSVNHYFIWHPKVDQGAGQLSLPHVGITKTQRNRTKNLISK